MPVNLSSANPLVERGRSALGFVYIDDSRRWFQSLTGLVTLAHQRKSLRRNGPGAGSPPRMDASLN